MVFYKKHTGVSTISYDAAVEEALCFGWIDSIVKRLDEDRYARKFTPRTNSKMWSEANMRRVKKLRVSRKMTNAGMAVFDPERSPTSHERRKSTGVPAYFRRALEANPEARAFFGQLAPSYRRQFIGWVDSAKREETRRRRLAEAISLLEDHRKLGMK